jgi:hypothetical protein
MAEANEDQAVASS